MVEEKIVCDAEKMSALDFTLHGNTSQVASENQDFIKIVLHHA